MAETPRYNNKTEKRKWRAYVVYAEARQARQWRLRLTGWEVKARSSRASIGGAAAGKAFQRGGGAPGLGSRRDQAPSLHCRG